jgi:hypothetical protein
MDRILAWDAAGWAALQATSVRCVEVVGCKAAHPTESQVFFFEKRSKKLLSLQIDAGVSAATANKSLLVLFFKKELLPSFISKKATFSVRLALVPPAADRAAAEHTGP